jgi:hypothetical protein
MHEILSYSEYRQRLTLREADSDNPGNYLVVGDPQKKSTWHLPVKSGGTPNHRLMGAAWAALTNPNGYRGNRYQGPNAGAALSELKALYKSEGLPLPGERKSADGDEED